MKLTLTVEQSPDPRFQGRQMTFDDTGGSLGRGADNAWVLPDPDTEISRCHAAIKFEGGGFVVEDRSTNGTFHNTSGQLIGKNRSVMLADGDLVLLGKYELRVSIESATAPDQASEAAGSSAEQDSLLDGWEPAEAPELPERDEFDDILEASIGTDGGPEDGADDGRLPFGDDEPDARPMGLDLDDEGSSDGRQGDTDPVGDELQQSPEREYFQAPNVETDPEDEIPDEWDAFLTGFFEPQDSSVRSASSTESKQPPADDASAPPSPPRREDQPESGPRPSPPRPQHSTPKRERKPSPPPRSRSAGVGDGVVLERILTELGIGDAAGEVDPEDLAEQIGGVVRLVGEGLMQLLASRADIKNEFRIDQTRISSAENNPLKFSPSIEEAMRRVFVERDTPGFISGVRSFEQALNDLRAHQVAILAAVQGAIESVIRQFDPQQLEAKLKKISPISASTPLIRQAKSWNLFVDHYDEMASNLRHDAKKVFVREFAEAYERSSREIARKISEGRSDD
jgi:type VI secretion system FHA domain protein